MADKELAVIEGGLCAEKSAALKIRRKAEALREAIFEAAELNMTVELVYGTKRISMHKADGFVVDVAVKL